jgi:hypothetical protein
MVIVLVLVGLCVHTASALPGSGTQQDPWRIESLADFDEFASDPIYWSGFTRLETDVNLAGRTYSTAVIAPDTSSSDGFQGTAFTGVFDGNDHKLIGLTIDDGGAGNDFLGLFGNTSGTIQNLGVKNVSISSNGSYIGGLAGANYGTITSCYVTGSVSGAEQTGGLVGFNYGTTSSCYASCLVSGQDAVGGLVGTNYDGVIVSCYADGSVNGRDGVGGLVGYLYGALTNSYATGPVNGRDGVGGLVGYIHSDINGAGIVTACYATGSVSKTGSYAGGLAGYNYFGSMTACFWDTQTSSIADGVGNEDPDPAGAMGRTTAQMQTLSTFTSAGWDFTDTDGDPPDWWLPYNHYPQLVWGPYGDGRGTAQDPYQIWTPQQMNAIGTVPNDWDKHFILMADVNMSIYTGTQYNIIGTSWDHAFSGTFDGNGHIISNLTYTTAANISYVGVFGCVWGGTIQNIGLENILISSNGYQVGGLVGTNYGTITNCYAAGSISGINCVGGLVGLNESGGMLSSCYAFVSVSGQDSVGGLTGANRNGTNTSCYAAGSVIGERYVGGLAGYTVGSTFTNCYAAGPISGISFVGGLVGFNDYDSMLSFCYATGSVSGTDYVGGLVGHNRGLIDACFWDIQTSSVTDGVGNEDPDPAGAMGKTTAQMKTLSTFTSAGWDFVNVWGIGNGQTYPYLKTLTGINPADNNYDGTVDFLDLAILAEHWLEER